MPPISNKDHIRRGRALFVEEMLAYIVSRQHIDITAILEGKGPSP